MEISRGFKNNNPGNIRKASFQYVGEKKISTDPEFKQFYNIIWGYRALFILLRVYINIHKLNTIEKIVKVYAPPNENMTVSYIERLCRYCDLNYYDEFDFSDKNLIIKIASGIVTIENGYAGNRIDILKGYEFISILKYNKQVTETL
jgi:hypothetical protein